MREEILKGHTRRIKTGCGNLYITINEVDGEPKEVFIRLGKAGGCAASQSEALGRLVTVALKSGVPLEKLVKQLRGIGCHQPIGIGDAKVMSCADAVGICLARGLKKQEEPEPGKTQTITETHEVVQPTPKPKPKKAEEVPLSADPTAETIEIDHDAAIEWAVKKARETHKVQGMPTRYVMTPCPDCGAPVAIEEGCEKCHVCGYTKCG